MVGAVAANLANTFLAGAYQTGLAEQVSTVATGGSGSDRAGAAAAPSTTRVGQDQAQISGPGQLLSQLQQLQAQDPTTFQNLVSNIATELQTAAQQTTGDLSQILANLANQFQAASTGDLSQVQPQRHAHHGQGTYNQAGQVTPSTSATDTSSTSGGASLQQLFATISSQVAAAVGTGT